VVPAGLLGLAYLSYLRHPQRIHQRKNLRPLDPLRERKFHESVQSLAQEAQLKVMPEIRLGPRGTQDGQAFGFRSHPFLRLGSGLKAMRLYPEHQAEFRAVVLHELAHIRNEDVHRSYFAEAVWKSLLALAMPLVILIGLSAIPLYYDPRFDPTPTRFAPIFAVLTAILTAIYLAVILALMVLVVHFIRRGALRVRESYADWRAVQWGALDGLVRILGNARDERHSLWQRLLRAHPRFTDRLNALRDPYQLFQVSFDLPLINGFLLGCAFGGAGVLVGLVQVSSLVGSGPIVTFLFALLGIAVFAALLWMLSATLGLQIQREAVADLVKNKHGLMPYLRLLPLAFLLHLGFEAALLLMPYENLQVDPFVWGWAGILVLPFWIAGIAVMTWLWMSAIRFFARRWIGSHTGTRLPTLKINLLTLLSVPVLPALYYPFLLVRGWPSLGQENLVPAFLALVVIGGLFLAFCAAGWLIITYLFLAKCPHCRARRTPGKTQGQLCTECGGELNEWLFT
jgi:Zn-dependent protease with chaperone function